MRSLFVLLSVLVALPVFPQQRLTEAKAVDRIVTNAMRAWDIPGVAVAVVRNDRVIYAAGYGVKEVGGTEPVTIDTLFQIGSTSKAFTTAAAAMLVEEKKLAWDDPVRKHLDYFRLSDLCADSHVTFRDLASHRTGLARHDELWDNSPWSREEVIRRISTLDLARSFRSGYQYQNIMYIAAGEVVGRAAGMPWDEFVRQRLFEPLGMSRTVTSDEEWRRSDHATGHRYDRRNGRVAPRRPIPTENLGGAGAIKSTARDMANWLRFHLADGAFEGKQLVGAHLLEETRAPQTVIRMGEATRESNPETSLMSYGLGWIIQDYRGELLVSHSGTLNGFRTHVDLLPKRDTGFVVLTNSDRSRAVVAIRNALVDMLTRKEARDWNAYYQMIEWRTNLRDSADRDDRVAGRRSDTAPSHALAAYAGIYENSAYGRVEIVESEGGLLLRWNRLEVPMTHFHYDVFTVSSFEDDLDEQVVFETSVTGEVNILTLWGQRFDRRGDVPRHVPDEAPAVSPQAP